MKASEIKEGCKVLLKDGRVGVVLEKESTQKPGCIGVWIEEDRWTSDVWPNQIVGHAL